MDDEHGKIVREVIRQLEMPSDLSTVCAALVVVALTLLGGYFALRWLDSTADTQLVANLFNGR
jgi:hypothetical protein